MCDGRYKALWESLFEHFGPEEYWELDGARFEELAEEHKLIRWEIYDPEKHGEMDLVPGEDQCWVRNDLVV